MLSERPVHIGTDSLALVKKGTAILEHQKNKNEAKLREQNGALILGGATSHLHRDSPWKQRWKLMKDGDLWQGFSQSAAEKNPEAIKLTKVKGHATRKMVIDKEVRAEDRFGNNGSDQAADKGVFLQQPYVCKIARFYSEKHKRYKGLMKDVHHFIISTKKAEKELREAKKKEADPFDTKANKAITIPNKLLYDEGTTTFRCTMRYARMGECSTHKEYEDLKLIANFVSNIEWSTEWKEEGGITWIEFYLLYRIHSKKIEIDPLASDKPLLSDITTFKSRIRRVSTYCMKEEEEWVVSTSYSRENRLKKVAVDNKHAAIQGMPKIKACEAESILKMILTMKGATSKKQKAEHEQGFLKLQPRPLTYKGTARNWCTHLELREDWTANDLEIQSPTPRQMHLKYVICPACMEYTHTKEMKLKNQQHFSNLKCQACKATASSRKWLCECGGLWYKCAVHYRIQNSFNSFSSFPKRNYKRKCSERGLDLPFPEFRKRTSI